MVKHGSSIKLTMYGSFPVQSISVEIFTVLCVKFHKQAAGRHCYYNWFVASAVLQQAISVLQIRCEHHCRTAFFHSSRSEAVSSIIFRHGKGSKMANPVTML